MIKVNDLSFSYRDQKIIDSCSFTIEAGEFVAITGSNGSGKSTLLKLLLGFLTPDTGTIVIDQKDVSYIPQQGLEDVEFPVSVEELLGFRLNQRAHRKERIAEALKLVGMQEHGKALIKNLSGGQRQRVLLARELVVDSKVLFLDEPNNGLDQASIESLYKLLKKLNTEKNLTIVLVTHNLDDIHQGLSRVLKLNQGVVRELEYVKV